MESNRIESTGPMMKIVTMLLLRHHRRRHQLVNSVSSNDNDNDTRLASTNNFNQYWTWHQTAPDLLSHLIILGLPFFLQLLEVHISIQCNILILIWICPLHQTQWWMMPPIFPTIPLTMPLPMSHIYPTVSVLRPCPISTQPVLANTSTRTAIDENRNSITSNLNSISLHVPTNEKLQETDQASKGLIQSDDTHSARMNHTRKEEVVNINTVWWRNVTSKIALWTCTRRAPYQPHKNNIQ